MIQEVYLIDNDDKIKDKLVKMFEKEEDYKFKKAKTREIDTVLRNIPALIIINEDNIDEDIIKLCNDIRNNEDNSITPIIVISSNREKAHRIETLKACVEHYIIASIDEDISSISFSSVARTYSSSIFCTFCANSTDAPEDEPLFRKASALAIISCISCHSKCV